MFSVIRVSSKQTKKKLGSNRNKPIQDLFWFVSWNKKQKNSVCFGLFRCFKPISKQPKQTNCFETNRNNPKFSEKIPKYALYQTVPFDLLFVSVQSNMEALCFGIEAKQPKKLFRNKSKQTGKTLNILKKYQNMLPIKLFRLVFCFFRFNRNIETLCFGIEAKKSKQKFCPE